MGGRHAGGEGEFAVSRKTSFAGERHEVFGLREKRKKVTGPEKVSEKSGLRKIGKVEKLGEVYRA